MTRMQTYLYRAIMVALAVLTLAGVGVLLSGCAPAAAFVPVDDTPTDTPPTDTPTEPETPEAPVDPPVPPPEPPPVPTGLDGPVLAALYDGTTVRLWDGASTVDFDTGASAHVNGTRLVVGPMLYMLTPGGVTVDALGLPASPDGVHVRGDGSALTFLNYTAQEAMDIDWTPGARTRIWQDGADLGDWHERAWTYVRSYETAGGDVVAVDTVGRFQVVTRPALITNWVVWAVPQGPIFYMSSVDPETMTVYDADYPQGRVVSWTGGGILRWGGQPWLQGADGIWYTGYGDTWDPEAGAFATRATSMQVFRSPLGTQGVGVEPAVYYFPQGADTAVMIGMQVQGSQLLFLECNTGTLWAYTPQTDVVSYEGGLYAGNGKNDTGFAKAATLRPQTIDGDLYYHDQGTVWRRATASGVVQAFSAEQEVWGWVE